MREGRELTLERAVRGERVGLTRRDWMRGGVATVSSIAVAASGLRPAVAGHAADLANDAQSAWWTWRGPLGNNVAATAEFVAGAITPDRVLWQAPVPGRGHSSPIVTKDAIYLTTADTQAGTQSLLAFGRATGQPLWSQVVHRGGLPVENHPKNTEASPSVAFDGQRVLTSFYNSDAIWLSAHGSDGSRLWQKSVGRYVPNRYRYGYAASPAIYGDTAIIIGEWDGPSFLAAIALDTGEVVWKTERIWSTSFSSPIVAHVAGRDQLVVSGLSMIASYEPTDGKQLWKANAIAMATCGTVVWDDQHVYASGGFPESQTACVRADGSAEIIWSNNQKCYEQSMLCAGGYVYAVTDQGLAYCWRARDGETMWRERLGGKYSSSPLLVGDAIYAFNEDGDSFAFRSSPEGFVSIGEAKIGDEVFASPAVVGDTMYLRVARIADRERQEYLLAIR